MPTLRDSLLPVVNDGRQLAADLGLRRRVVATCLSVWSGPRAGDGARVNTVTTITPPPKVREPPGRLVAEAGGKFVEGDLVISKIDPLLTHDELTGGTLATGSEWFILVDSMPYRIVGEPTLKNFATEVLVRRVTGRASMVQTPP